MKAGAVDFLEKPFDDETLLNAIGAALAKAAKARRRPRASGRRPQRIATLSPREREVLDGLLAGRQNKVIAFDLDISVRTVEVHRARALDGRLGQGSSPMPFASRYWPSWPRRGARPIEIRGYLRYSRNPTNKAQKSKPSPGGLH